MSLLHHDDIPDDPPGTLRWTEYTVRVLEPSDLAGAFLLDNAVHFDIQGIMPLGGHGRCEKCGLVTINTKGFPHGQHHYRTLEGQVIIADQYCPACDGGENV